MIRIGGSCDLTPLDFFLRGCSKSKVYVERSHNAHHERFSHDREKFRGGHLPYPTYFVIRLKDKYPNTLFYIYNSNLALIFGHPVYRVQCLSIPSKERPREASLFRKRGGKIDVCDRRKFKLREFEPQNARLPFVPPRFGELETLELEWDTRSIRDKSELLSLSLSQERVKIKKKNEGN